MLLAHVAREYAHNRRRAWQGGKGTDLSIKQFPVLLEKLWNGIII